MYNSKSKTAPASPSDAQAKEKLALYVYEYLIHNGAPKSAEIFMREMQFDKSFHLGESPGFLSSWWSIFWDLYCSAPERRCNNPHSDEAKAFHDYGFVNGQHNGQIYMNGMHNSNAPSPLGQMPPNDGMPGGPMPPAGFFANSHMRPSPTQQPVNQPSPHSQMIQTQAFLSPRYPGAPGPRGPNVRITQQLDFNPPPSGVPGQPMMPNNMDPNRQGEGGEFVGWQGPPTMQQMNPRMSGPHPPQPRVPPMGQMGTSFNCNMGQFPPSMRPPTGPNGPPVNGQNGQPNGQQMQINMPAPGGPPGGPGRQWPNNNMNYNSSSPGNHYGPPVSSNSGPGPAPGTPIMPSPQGSAGPYSPASHRMGTPNTGRDSSGSGVDGMYPIMKQVPGVNIPNFVMNDPNLQVPPTSSPLPSDPILESIKQSPGHASQEQSNSEHNNLDYNNIVPYQENDQNESAAILKIKESMQEEAKRFEKEPSGDHSEFYIQ